MVVYQGMPPVRRRELGSKKYLVAHISGDDDQLLYPCYTRLGMGSSIAADVVLAVLRHGFSLAVMSDSFKLPTAEALWINWPGDPDVQLVAWEIFGGSCVWTSFLREFDIASHFPAEWPSDLPKPAGWWLLTPIELLLGPEHDVLDPHFRLFARRVLLSRRVYFLHTGSPCSSFSIAQTPSIRTWEFPDGAPWNNPRSQREIRFRKCAA